MSYAWPIEEVREITGLGGRDEDAARAAVGAGAQWIDENHYANMVFRRDDDGVQRAETVHAAMLLAAMEQSASAYGGISAMQVGTCLRHINRYWLMPAGLDRWQRYLDTMKAIDGVCRYCGEKLDSTLDNWIERTRCIRCVRSREGAAEIRRMIGGGA